MEELRSAGLDPLLIAPRHFYYSGLATAVLSGALPPDANRIDVADFAARRSLRYIEGKASEVHPESRTVLLEDGDRVPYDMVSLNSGSEVVPTIAGEGAIWPIKPLVNLTSLRSMLEAQIAAGNLLRVAIAGAGATGTEIAASLCGLAERHHGSLPVTLAGPIRRGPGWAQLYRTLERRGVTVLADRKIARRTADSVRLDDGSERRCDLLVAATGLAPAGGRAVGPTLQSLEDPAIFASGDCAEFAPRPLPRHGVFGVRQAPVLAHNLIALAHGEPLIRYRPQQRFLAILDLGNGEGFATWGGLANRSRAALRLKRRLDFAFMRRFQP